MLQAPVRRRLPRLLALIFVFGLARPFVQAQTSPQESFRLRVVEAKYLPETGSIEYKLANRGTAEVIAYSLRISVFVNAVAATRTGDAFGSSLNLLAADLLGKCQNVPANAADEDAKPWPDTLRFPSGVIEPGNISKQTMNVVDLDDSKLKRAPARVEIRVTGILWSDGSIEGIDGQLMQSLRDDEREAGIEEDKALPILRSHEKDGDIQRRINETVRGLQSLKKDYPRTIHFPDNQPGVNQYVSVPQIVEGMISSLEEAAYLPNSMGRYDYLNEFWTCVHERRAAMMKMEPVAVESRR